MGVMMSAGILCDPDCCEQPSPVCACSDPNTPQFSYEIIPISMECNIEEEIGTARCVEVAGFPVTQLFWVPDRKTDPGDGALGWKFGNIVQPQLTVACAQGFSCSSLGGVTFCFSAIGQILGQVTPAQVVSCSNGPPIIIRTRHAPNPFCTIVCQVFEIIWTQTNA